ncbi:aldolase/citrate lyase family protein [Rothia sp. AR01]|uniref:Aldolase/citrate lyase family protein n=1 Tax=Rothia santali TaxID=2949643 RepID=A0A9X2HD10_9MICC|nr:aldolase/citrate lyase family protein [Rothia santali]MCP3427116.1 aldolase/citrate lyase family protein [Rothia santali]
MPLRVELPPTFADALREAERPLVGMWVCSGSPVAAEIAGCSGLDWVLVDGEHSPVGLETAASLLRALAPYPVVPMLRVPELDAAHLKQVLDLGAQNVLVPMVDTAEQARAAAAAVRYPPHGVRGVGSALARASRWGAVEGYLAGARETVSLTVQIESAAAVANAGEIAAVDGVDAVFVGPADLAASMGVLGQQTHPDVVDAVLRTFDAVRAAGKPVGVNVFDHAQAHRYLDAGASFALVGADVQLLTRASRGLAEAFLPAEG